MTSLLAVVAVLAAAPVEVARDGFPQWRGPNRDGKSPETGLFAKPWPEGGPSLVWEHLEIGIGYGSPAVVGGKVYVLGGQENQPGSAEWLLCLSADDGKELWRTPLATSPGNFNAGWGGGPRSTPTVAGGFVYALGATGDLVCVNAGDGAKQWAKNLVKDFGGGIPAWGYSESPLVDRGHVVVTPGKKGGMVALDARTGDTVWKCELTHTETRKDQPTPVPDGAGYSSIVAAVVGDVPVYVQQTMSQAVVVRATDGKLLFNGGGANRAIAVIPTPVVADGYAFFTSGYGFGCECFKLTPDGSDGVKAEPVFTKVKALANHHGGVVAVGDHVYGHSDSGGWTCLPFKERNPEPAWQSTKFGKGSILYADGHFVLYSEKGDVSLIKATPEKWDEVGRFTLPKKSPTDKKSGAVWAHPVIAGGKVYLRDFDYLFCFELKVK
jgi:outer membrane protein assembly factor BamB